ncbi:hypothetical protein [Nakamurella lactea]|uniref:hypothetical protein n=1 Tax=Nakamurella lactea TaxID=459515 RepID=UPI00041F8789|nr:hypothetical protein [Nakamurella lactea]
MSALTLRELSTESAELLPTRETLDFIHVNYANVWASNSSLALNAASLFSLANSSAAQVITVAQG